MTFFLHWAIAIIFFINSLNMVSFTFLNKFMNVALESVPNSTAVDIRRLLLLTALFLSVDHTCLFLYVSCSFLLNAGHYSLYIIVTLDPDSPRQGGSYCFICVFV